MDIPNLGKRCSFIECGQLDFLPFHCDLCGKYYCLKHAKKDDHNCVLKIQGPVFKKVILPKICSMCGKKSIYAKRCTICSQYVCFYHMKPPLHQCK